MSPQEMRFALAGGAHVLFTARAHGNLSSVGGAGAEYGLRAREELREQLGLLSLLRGYQVHGTTIRCLSDGVGSTPSLEPGDMAARPAASDELTIAPDSNAQPEIQADGQATTQRGLGATVLTADCLPVALGCSGAVAMVHAGWRGLAAGVLEEGVSALRDLGGESEIEVVIGPGAGPCCYEVGEEVHNAFGGAHRDGANIDLKSIARDRLLVAGVGEIQDVAVCTICDERFFSHRREGTLAGRQCGVAWRS